MKFNTSKKNIKESNQIKNTKKTKETKELKKIKEKQKKQEKEKTLKTFKTSKESNPLLNKINTEEECINKLCKRENYDKYSEKSINSAKLVLNDLVIDNENKLKNKDLTDKERKIIEEDLSTYKLMLENKINKKIENKEKMINELIERCKTEYCNNNCIGTIFEDGDPNELPLSFIEKNKDNKIILDISSIFRKEIFGEQKSVLNNNFYNKIKMNDIKKFKKKGALSCCSTKIYKHLLE